MPVIPTLSKKLVILTGAKRSGRILPGAPGLDSETWESDEPMQAGFVLFLPRCANFAFTPDPLRKHEASGHEFSHAAMLTEFGGL